MNMRQFGRLLRPPSAEMRPVSIQRGEKWFRMKIGCAPTEAGPLEVVSQIQQDLERLNILVQLLHDQGLIPTDLFLLSTLRQQREATQREVSSWLTGPDAVCVPKSLTDKLAELDRQIGIIEAAL